MEYMNRRYGIAVVLAVFLLTMAPVHGQTQEQGDEIPLIKAVGKGKAAVEAVLLKHPDVKVARTTGWTALHEAAFLGDTEIIELLASQGADLDALTRSNISPLMIALGNDQATASRLLLTKGCKTTFTDTEGWTALHLATRKDDPELVRLLLERGAPIDIATKNTGIIPLDIACALGHQKVVTLLLEKGSNANHLDLDNFSPLHRTARNRHPEIARLLLAKGADPKTATIEFKLTPLHFAAATDSLELVEMFLKAGADPNATDVDGDTPLQRAVRGSTTEVTRRLLEGGAAAGSKNVHGLTPLHYAAMRGSGEMVDLLLAHGADIEAKALQWIEATPLHLAIEGGHTEAVDRLLAKGANPNAPIRNRQDQTEEWTPLTLAETDGKPEILELLRRKGGRRGQTRRPIATSTVALYHVTIDRIGGSQPGDFPPNLRRNLDKLLEKIGHLFSGATLEAGKFCRGTGILQDIVNLRPTPRSDWTADHRQAMETLSGKVTGLRRDLGKDIPPPSAGFAFDGMADLKTLYELLGQATQHPLSVLREGTQEATRMRTKMEFFAQMFSIGGLRGALDSRGLKLNAAFLGGPKFMEIHGDWLERLKTLPRSVKYLDPDALFGLSSPLGSQNQKALQSPGVDDPKWKIFEKYLLDVGLDFHRDINPCLNGDVTLTLSLDPIGDGGLPDLRVIASVGDPTKVEALGPALKKLAQNLGIFVAAAADASDTWKISYFLNPQFPLHLRKLGNLYLAATGVEGLQQLATRVRKIDEGSLPAFQLPTGFENVLRVHLSRLNEQIQRFAQSPLGKGANLPPLANFPVLQELGTLQAFGHSQPEGVFFHLEIPIAKTEGR